MAAQLSESGTPLFDVLNVVSRLLNRLQRGIPSERVWHYLRVGRSLLLAPNCFSREDKLPRNRNVSCATRTRSQPLSAQHQPCTLFYPLRRIPVRPCHSRGGERGTATSFSEQVFLQGCAKAKASHKHCAAIPRPPPLRSKSSEKYRAPRILEVHSVAIQPYGGLGNGRVPASTLNWPRLC